MTRWQSAQGLNSSVKKLLPWNFVAFHILPAMADYRFTRSRGSSTGEQNKFRADLGNAAQRGNLTDV
jgi:hypothetical protein